MLHLSAQSDASIAAKNGMMSCCEAVKSKDLITEVTMFIFDKQERRRILRNMSYPRMMLWAIIFSLALVFKYFLFAADCWSFTFGVGTILSLLSFVLMALTMKMKANCSGVSTSMLECYSVLLVARCLAVIPFDGYVLIEGGENECGYKLLEFVTTLACLYATFLAKVTYRDTVDTSMDKIKSYYLMLPCVLLALCCHLGFNDDFGFLGYVSDICWMFSCALEAVAALPQLYVFVQNKVVETHVSHFLVMQVVAKFCTCLFWMNTCKALYVQQFGGLTILLVGLLQVVQFSIMSDFLYQYVKSIRQGVSLSCFAL